MTLMFNLIYIILLIFLFFAVKGLFDPQTWSNFWTFMAGDYPMLWDKYFTQYLSLSSPITLVISTMLILGIVRAVIERKKHDYR